MDDIAVYWDFENIHASLCSLKFGENWYRKNRYIKQPQIVDIDAIMEYVTSLGNVNINKAYGNWGFFHPYNYDMQNHAVDLVQLFPRGSHGKNGADIRMAIDIIEDVNQNSHISLVVVVGGDSDYISIAQKIRQKGRKIVAIGVRGATNQYWIRSCNEFKFYSSLIVKASSSNPQDEIETFQTESVEEAKELLCRAVAAISAQQDGGPVLKAAVKPMMTRLDSSFDEANYGYRSFTSFLNACGDVVEVTSGQYDHMVTVKEESICSYPPNDNSQGVYNSILRKQQVRLVSPDIMKVGIQETYNIFNEKKFVGSYTDYKNELLDRLKSRGFSVTETDASKLKGLLFKIFAFRISPEQGGIALSEKIKSSHDLIQLIRYTVIKRILDNIEGKPDRAELGRLLYGDDFNSLELDRHINAYKKAEQEQQESA